MDSKPQLATNSRRANTPRYIENDLQVLENCFQHDKDRFSTLLFEYFSKQTNVYTFALDILYYSKDFYKYKVGSFSHILMESLRKWCSSYDPSHLLTLDVKCHAVNKIIQQPNGSLIHLVCDIFKLKEDFDHFRVIIKNFLKEKKFKEAYHLITSLNAERAFSLEEFVFPVFFLDKDAWVKHFLKNSEEHLIEFVQKLDSICQNSEDIRNFIKTFPYDNLPLRKHVYDTSRLQKMLVNIIEYFDIDIKNCKNLYRVRCENAMYYLIRKRYQEETISEEAFEELIKLIASDDPLLQKNFLTKLVFWVGDCTTALKFAEDFKLNRNDYPTALQDVFPQAMGAEGNSIPFDDFRYLKLRVDRSDIVFIDTPDQCIDAVTDIAENYDVVGIDAEWRPNLGISNENLAVYQIAVWDTVYLLDVLKLKQYPDQKFWSYIIEKIFQNKNILKLGYGIEHDLQHLCLCTVEKTEPSKFPRVLDFCELFKKLDNCYPEVMAAMTDNEYSDSFCYRPMKGLGELCAKVLGKPLNKDEQFSDWERRPLRENQVVYAALDAYCLLLLFEKLYNVLDGLNLNFDEVIKKTLKGPQKDPNAIKKIEKKPVVNVKSDFKPIPISQFRVVVDNMLQGLGKYLRLCGADVAFLENDDDHMKAVQISHAENRIILSAGAPYNKLSGYVHEDMCYCVTVNETAVDQALAALEYFNVQCTSSDIFSRCSACSGNKFKKVPNRVLYSLWNGSANTSDDTVREEKYSYPAGEQHFLSEDGKLESGVQVQFSSLTSRVFETVAIFFICVSCGKVYWEGSHFNRMKKTFSKLLDEKDSGVSIYQAAKCPTENTPKAECETKPVESVTKSAPVLTGPVSTSSTRKNVYCFDLDVSSEDDDDLDIVYT